MLTRKFSLRRVLLGLKAKTAGALVLCALIPIGAGTLVTGYLSKSALRTEVIEKLDRAATTSLNAVVGRLNRSLDQIEVAGVSNVMQDVLIEDGMGAIGDFLSGFRSAHEEFGTVAVFGETGRMIAADGEGGETVADFAASRQFRDALGGATEITSDGVQGVWSGGTIVLSRPIRADYDEGTIVGVLVGVLNSGAFLKQLESIQISGDPQDDDHILVLTDRNGRVLYQTATNDHIPTIDQLLISHAILDGRAENSDPSTYIASSDWLAMEALPGSMNLGVHIFVSEVKAQENAYRLQRKLLITGSLVALVLIGATMVAIELIVLRPSQRLGDAIVGSRRHRPIPADLLSRRDELGILTRTFAKLMEQLSAARSELITNSQAEIAKRGALLDAALDNMSEGLCLFDSENRLTVSNCRFVEMFGIESDAIIPNATLDETLDAMLAAGTYTTEDVVALSNTLKANAASGTTNTFLLSIHDDRTISVAQVSTPNGGWVVTFSDVTEQRNADAKMEHMALHDALTGLPNRVKFQNELEQILQDGKRQKFAVLCLDLDHFKPVNDTLGHAVGDLLLQAVSKRISLILRDCDIVARIGGDEFVILQKRIKSAEESATLAERIIASLSQPFEVDGHQIVVGASVGVSLAPADGDLPQTIVKAADLALYRAKSDGRGIYCFFEAEMDALMQERRTLELDLRKAVAGNEFVLNYQPILNVATNEITCFEALIRWNHPKRGLVKPDQFIPLAEEIGLIREIGSWVLRQACRDAVNWPESILVAVNLSPLQFRGMELVVDVKEAISQSGLAAERLELEITESVLLTNTDATLRTLDKLRSLGARISMDDFGTGYSSLGYLRKFAFDKIKIDQSFAHDLHESADARAIVRAITSLGSSLGVCTTVEGIETIDQLEAVRAEGCTEVQGYYFSQPVPNDQLEALLERQHSDNHLEDAQLTLVSNLR